MKKTVESFKLECGDWHGLFDHSDPVDMIEQDLISRLDKAVSLLRWAVVSVDDQSGSFSCEGAYIKSA